MRFALLMTLALSLAAAPLAPAATTAKKPRGQAATKSTRHPSATPAKASYRIVSFDCRDDNNQTGALGLAQLGVDVKNAEVGFFGLTLYVRTGEGSVTPKTLSGAYTTVPDGFILQANWPGAPGDQAFLHLHPRDRTQLPGLKAKLSCSVVTQLEQL